MILKRKKRHVLTPEEHQQMEKYLELQSAQKEIIELLNNDSCSFAEWLPIISDAVQEAIKRKQQLNTDCEKERIILEKLTLLFNTLTRHSDIYPEWHNQLTFRIDSMETIVGKKCL
jgi:hypothetical protein